MPQPLGWRGWRCSARICGKPLGKRGHEAIRRRQTPHPQRASEPSIPGSVLGGRTMRRPNSLSDADAPAKGLFDQPGPPTSRSPCLSHRGPCPLCVVEAACFASRGASFAGRSDEHQIAEPTVLYPLSNKISYNKVFHRLASFIGFVVWDVLVLGGSVAGS